MVDQKTRKVWNVFFWVFWFFLCFDCTAHARLSAATATALASACERSLIAAVLAVIAAIAAAALALGCRESTVMRGQCTVQGGEVWRHLGNVQRSPPRALRAQRARSEVAGVAHCPSDFRVSRWSRHKCKVEVHGTRRRGLASLDLPRTSAASGLASGASEARGGGRS